jgi:hypothetical protein
MNNSEKTYYKLIEEYPNSPKLGTIFVTGFEHLGGELVQPYVKHFEGGVTNVTYQHLDTKFYEKSFQMSEDGYPLFDYDCVYWVNGNHIKTFTFDNKKRDSMEYILFCFKLDENCKKYIASLKPILPKSWYDLPSISGYYVDGDDVIVESYNSALNKLPQSFEANTYKTVKQALSQIAFAKLTQLASNLNENWETDWSKYGERFTIMRYNDYVVVTSVCHKFVPICFKTAELRDFSFEHHKDLWRQYYELD